MSIEHIPYFELDQECFLLIMNGIGQFMYGADIIKAFRKLVGQKKVILTPFPFLFEN